MPKVPLNNNFLQAATVISIGLAGVWAYSYYTQTHDIPMKANTSERANSDPLKRPTIQQGQTSNKPMSAF
jgi:hypothetical protein